MSAVDDLNKRIKYLSLGKRNRVSDGAHTFGELYYHRMMLFSVLCNQHEDLAWKSWKHDDGSSIPGFFVVGIRTPEGQFSYHYRAEHWKYFDIEEVEYAPKYDGHTSEDITRLLSLMEKSEQETEGR